MSKLTIQAMGSRGEGIASANGQRIFVPLSLPNEQVEATIRDRRATLDKVVNPSPDRVNPPCQFFGTCGGCQLQHWDHEAYSLWKRQLVVDALSRRGLGDVVVADLTDAHGAGRRRVGLTIRNGVAGFAAQRSHRHVAVTHCIVLEPALANVMQVAAALATAAGRARSCKVHVLHCQNGLDCELADVDDPNLQARYKLSETAAEFDLARLTARGDLLVERRRPVLQAGDIQVTPPPGGFAQATAQGEIALSAFVKEALDGCRDVADLFCGWGPFALRLAREARVLAIDSDASAVAALEQAVRKTQGLKPVVAQVRDLMHEPLTAPEMRGLSAAVFDPPRVGAAAQASELADSGLTRVVAVACDPGTFARDARILVDGGFVLDHVVPVDQFRYTSHVELVGVFSR